jgi:hypothetical protein
MAKIAGEQNQKDLRRPIFPKFAPVPFLRKQDGDGMELSTSSVHFYGSSEAASDARIGRRGAPFLFNPQLRGL